MTKKLPAPFRNRFGMKKYGHEGIRDHMHVPELARPDHLLRLDRIAHRAIVKRTIEGNISAIIIYHQLAEELLKLLLSDCESYVKLSVHPFEFSPLERKRLLFGELCQLLNNHLSFPHKARILRDAELLNRARIEMVHQLARRSSLTGIRRSAMRARKLYDHMYDLFDYAHDYFRMALGEHIENQEKEDDDC